MNLFADWFCGCARASQELVPQRARLALSNGEWREVPAEAVTPGELLAVLPGDRLPVDGVVVGGRSTVDESALTGEPMPVTKAPGAHKRAGACAVALWVWGSCGMCFPDAAIRSHPKCEPQGAGTGA